MSIDRELIPLKNCVLTGNIKVTRSALELAKRFFAAVPTRHIVAFSWMDGRRDRASQDAPWVDHGPGLDIGAYRLDQIPEEAIHHAGSFRYAVLIRMDVVDRHPKKTIDLDASGNPILE